MRRRWCEMETKDWLTFLLATASFSFSLYNFFRTARISERQFVIQFTQDVHKWADQVLSLFIEPMSHGLNGKPDKHLILSHHAATTSVLWDLGRLLFPNHPAGNFGTEKGVAFEGIRPRVLDAMKLLYDQLCSDVQSAEAGGTVSPSPYMEIKREFISCVQADVGTRVRYGEVRRRLGPNTFDQQIKLAEAIRRRQ